MPRSTRKCAVCGERPESSRWEAHMASHRGGGLGFDLDDIPEAAKAQFEPIDPFEIGAFPEFESNIEGEEGSESVYDPPDVTVSGGEPAFSESSLASIFKLVFDALSDMLDVGEAGKLTEGEARLLAGLSMDFVNEQFGGHDPSKVKMVMAVAVILLTKARVYYAAIQKKRNKTIEGEASENSNRINRPQASPSPAPESSAPIVPPEIILNEAPMVVSDVALQ